MASSLINRLEDELQCSMCLERLKDPRVFPCEHSFCYQCIVDLSQGKSKISCPECRAEVEVGDPPDLSHFKRNVRINNILECLKNDLPDSTKPDIYHQSKSQTSLFDDSTQRNSPVTAESRISDVKERQPKNDVETAILMKHDQGSNSPSQSNLDIGSLVEVLSKNHEPKYGVIRWIGFLPNSDKEIAGLELEEELCACTDGTFHGKRYFTCPARRGFFVHLHKCLPDSRFNRNSTENSASKRLTGTGSPASTHHQQMPNSPLQSKLDVGSMVEVTSNRQKPKYGVIRWIGFLPNTDKEIAGLELEGEMNACTDGTFHGKRYFTCPTRRGFFVHLHLCSADSRFK